MTENMGGEKKKEMIKAVFSILLTLPPGNVSLNIFTFSAGELKTVIGLKDAPYKTAFYQRRNLPTVWNTLLPLSPIALWFYVFVDGFQQPYTFKLDLPALGHMFLK